MTIENESSAAAGEHHKRLTESNQIVHTERMGFMDEGEE